MHILQVIDRKGNVGHYPVETLKTLLDYFDIRSFRSVRIMEILQDNLLKEVERIV